MLFANIGSLKYIRSSLIGALCSLLLLFVIFPELFSYAYVVIGVIIGWILYRKCVPCFPFFALWVWIITPGIRRLSDWNLGELSGGILMVTPYLVTGFAWLTAIKYAKGLKRREAFPYLIASIPVVFSFFIGWENHGFYPAFYAFLQWIIPIGFGLHLALQWRIYPLLQRNLHKFFVWGILFSAAYAITQFVVLPEWDRIWMINVNMRSIGVAEPYHVRVFSTLNSPGPYAVFTMAGLVYLFGLMNLGAKARLAIFLGYPAFLLTLVRSSWGGWMVGVALLSIMFGPQQGVKLIVKIIIFMFFIMALMIPFVDSEFISNRVSTFSNLDEDVSFISRLSQYKQISSDIIVNPVGHGLGVLGEPGNVVNSEVVDRYGAFDSGLLEIPYMLGWVGGFVYIMALVMLCVRIAKNLVQREDRYILIYCAIILAIISQLVFGPAHRGVSGVLLWGIIGISMSGIKYNQAYEKK